MKFTIKVSEELKTAWPQFAGAAVYAKVTNTPYNEALWERINQFVALYREQYTTDSIKSMPAIQATRAAYKACGKDPSRYRPSSEALCRRILRGIPLYQIDTLVDLINLASIRSGHSIGGFDADKIQGDTLVLGIGKANEPYEGIGRGELNIEGMPVYRDAVGGVATPTSDEERTKITIDTCTLQMNINGFGSEMPMEEAVAWSVELLRKYANATEVETAIVS